MRAVPTFLTLIVLASFCSCTHGSRQAQPPLRVVPYVDVKRYMGTWYEIASYPHRFQKGCVASTATYSLRDDGDVTVLNQCRLDSLDGKISSARGKARVVDKTTNAKLEVSFFWPFWGDYWVIDLDEEYSYAVVGHPSRDYLWILSRFPKMDDRTYEKILDRLVIQSYDVGRLVKTLHAEGPAAAQ